MAYVKNHKINQLTTNYDIAFYLFSYYQSSRKRVLASFFPNYLFNILISLFAHTFICRTHHVFKRGKQCVVSVMYIVTHILGAFDLTDLHWKKIVWYNKFLIYNFLWILILTAFYVLGCRNFPSAFCLSFRVR